MREKTKKFLERMAKEHNKHSDNLQEYKRKRKLMLRYEKYLERMHKEKPTKKKRHMNQKWI